MDCLGNDVGYKQATTVRGRYNSDEDDDGYMSQCHAMTNGFF